jgi:hypothetical protein
MSCDNGYTTTLLPFFRDCESQERRLVPSEIIFASGLQVFFPVIFFSDL